MSSVTRIIGAQMLMLRNTRRLHIQAEKTDIVRLSASQMVPYGMRDTDMIDHRQNKRVDAQYNAWWCCLIPADVIAAARPGASAPTHEVAEHLVEDVAQPGATGLELLLSLALKWADACGSAIQSAALSRALAKITIDAARVAGLPPVTVSISPLPMTCGFRA